MDSSYNQLRQVGVLLKRDDIVSPRIKEVYLALHLQLLDVNFSIQAIDAFLKRDLYKLDGLVGDCKCQVRVSIILDLLQDFDHLRAELRDEQCNLKVMSSRIQNLLQIVNFDNYLEIKKIIKELNGLTLYDFFERYNINFALSNNLILISACFLTAFNQQQLKLLVNEAVSFRRITTLLNHSTKAMLNQLSVNIENDLALQYGSMEDQIILKQIESKGFCSATAFYPSFKPVLAKMKCKKQSFVKKNIHFCACGGIQRQAFDLYSPSGQSFKKTLSILPTTEAAMIIEGYQFPGTLDDLKNILGVPMHETFIRPEYFKPCQCGNSSLIPKIDNAEEAVLANFAQHPQFTNGAEIDWKGLGLEDSDLKKEYDYLNTLSGYGINDMSKFCIRHIYAATLEQVVEEQKNAMSMWGVKKVATSVKKAAVALV
jgi:hypothetical protein